MDDRNNEEIYDRLYERCAETRDNLKKWLHDDRMPASKKTEVARLIRQFGALARKFERKET